MRCPHCKEKNADNAVFCKHCNQWILESVYKGAKVSRFRFRRLRVPRWVKPAAVSVAMLLLIVLGLSLLQNQQPPADTTGPALAVPTTTGKASISVPAPTTTPGPTFPPETTYGTSIDPIQEGYILCQNSIEAFPYGDTLQFLQGSQILKTDAQARVKYTMKTSLDGNVGVCLTGEYKLYLIHGDAVTQLATQVRSFALSASGNGIAYRTIDGNLYLYNVLTGESDLVADPASYSVSNYVISPDGKTVLFTAFHYNEEDPTKSRILVQYRAGQTYVMGSYASGLTPISVSNNGNVVYLFSGGYIYAVDASGTLTDLGIFRIHPESENTDLPGGKMYLNADHTQLLYYQENGTYLSVDGQVGRHVAPAVIEPIAPQSTLEFTTEYAFTYPHLSLLDQPYRQCSEAAMEGGIQSDTVFTVWYLKQDAYAYIMYSVMQQPILDCSGEYLYGLAPNGRLAQLSMAEAKESVNSFSSKIFDKNVDKFALSPDGTQLAYIARDTLYRCVPNDNQEVIAEVFNASNTISGLYFTVENHFFWVQSESIYSAPVNMGFRVFNVIYTKNGILYYRGDTAFYMIQQDGTPLKLCDIVG